VQIGQGTGGARFVRRSPARNWEAWRGQDGHVCEELQPLVHAVARAQSVVDLAQHGLDGWPARSDRQKPAGGVGAVGWPNKGGVVGFHLATSGSSTVFWSPSIWPECRVSEGSVGKLHWAHHSWKSLDRMGFSRALLFFI
jgi:hypothetical protein